MATGICRISRRIQHHEAIVEQSASPQRLDERDRREHEHLRVPEVVALVVVQVASAATETGGAQAEERMLR